MALIPTRIKNLENGYLHGDIDLGNQYRRIKINLLLYVKCKNVISWTQYTVNIKEVVIEIFTCTENVAKYKKFVLEI